jgi:phosphocarrier protein HPr
MKTRDIIIRCEHGLHARVAASVVRLVKDRDSTVQIRCKGCAPANACSVMELLMLGAGQGARLQIVADGPDEDAAVEAVAGVFADGSGI